MSNKTLDIFRVLNNVDSKDASFLSSLSDEERKAFQPFLVQRWLSGTLSARQVYFLNEIVNPYVFSLPNHKLLLWQLMTLCTSGKPQRYTWHKLPGGGGTSKPVSTRVVADYLGYSTKDATQALLLLSRDDVLSYATELGRQSDDMAKIKKEIKHG